MKNELKLLGFSEKEIKVYLAVLKVKTTSVSRINEITGIPRPTIYDVLNSLMAKGIITTYKKDKKSYYGAVEPSQILEQFREKEKIIKRILPDLKKLAGSIEKKPSVNIYEGKNGLLSLLNEIYKEKELFVYGSAKKSMQVFGHLPENFARKRVKLKIKMKAVLEKSKESFFRVEDPSIKKFTEIKFLNIVGDLPTVTFIYGESVAIISIEKELIGIKIEDKNISDTQMIIFNLLWGLAS